MTGFKSCTVKLHLLSPIHIGAGQELDPFSYIIRDDTLLLIDLLKWMEDYHARSELEDMMDSDDFIALRAYIADNFDNDNAIRGAVPIKSPAVISTYRKAIKDKNSENQVLINFMTRNDITRVPYIPGSSIKGAIRTAIANRFVTAAGVTKQSKRDYNRKIFGNPTADPMKNLKISDVSLEGFGSFIYEAVEHSHKQSKTPKGGFEASASLCELDKPVILPLHLSLKNFTLFDKNIDQRFIVDALYDFYMPKFLEEYEKFYAGPNADDIRQAMAPLSLAAVSLKSNESLIRIGHFSHVECVTLDRVRNPKTRQGKDGKLLPWGMTRTLANGCYPFGWAKLEFLDLPVSPRKERSWPFSIPELEKLVKKRKQAAIKAEEARMRAEKIQREIEEQRIAEAKRKAELAAMSPEDRMIEEVKDPAVTENRVVEIFNTLDEFPADKKPALAAALKEYWQRHGKWKKKNCTKKQWKKVQKVKEILGDA